MKKTLGIGGLLFAICVFTAVMAPEFMGAENLMNVTRRTAFFGIISIGVAFVIITGGIDLSIGSVVALTGCCLSIFLAVDYRPVDQFAVERVTAAERAVVVRGDARTFAVGDRVLFTDGARAGDLLASVAAVRFEAEHRGPGGRPAPRTVVTLDRAPSADDAQGNLARAYAFGGFDAATRTVRVGGDQSFLRRDDRLVLYRGERLPVEFTVNSLRLMDGETVVAVRENRDGSGAEAAVLIRRQQRMPIPVAIVLILLLSVVIGVTHGLLITKLRLQPFVVTLCGLLIYRGLARNITRDQAMGFGNEYSGMKQVASGNLWETLTGTELVFDLPIPFLIMAVIGVVAAVFLNQTIYGRYLLALGNNEEAARYSGINTGRMTVMAYVICSFCAGVGGILFALDLNTIQPSGHGNFYELYAIAAAVLGGCSLRGGEGSILGVVIGAAVMRVLYNAINLIDGIDVTLELTIIGLVLLGGVIADELVKRMAAKRRAVREARESEGVPGEGAM